MALVQEMFQRDGISADHGELEYGIHEHDLPSIVCSNVYDISAGVMWLLVVPYA